MKRGFTLLELVIVIIVIGILAGLAMPQYFRVVEKGRVAEGLQILGLLRAAQLRYYAEKAVYTATVTDLDFEYTTPKYFTIAAVAGPTNLATATRNGINNPGYGSYALTIAVDGTITCSGGTAGACAKIGY